MQELFVIPDCRVITVESVGAAGLHVAAQVKHSHADCPSCQRPSQSVHSRYHRHPADLPSLGNAVHIKLLVRRFYCRNPICPRRTFAEPVPELLSPRARRTRRLAGAQGRVGVTCGGEAGARLLRQLGMPTSADTVLRLVHALPLPECAPPSVLGVDDWALRKGCSYGTILVDLEAHRVVDLLSDRTAQTLTDWLKDRDTVTVIARDRSTEYARGSALGAPGAVQVADRWHLLQNLRQMVERWLAGVHGRLRRLPPVSGGAVARRTGGYPRSRTEAAATADSRARRHAVYEEVRRRVAAGEKLLTISRTMGLARGTVRSYAHAQHFPERAVREAGLGILAPHREYLEARLAEGNENAAALWRELQDRGFAGSAKQVRRWLNQRRTGPAKFTPHKWRPGPSEAASTLAKGPFPALISPRQLAWRLVQAPQSIDTAATEALARISQDPEVAKGRDLVRRLAELIGRCGVGSDARPANPSAVLDSWLKDALSCGIPAVETFAAGVRQDEAAVKAALTMPWSSGQAEGQVNKLKLIKRQMYGRANFDLLRRRVLLAA
ncbi:ISL3 family transposase [Azospirillum doebereinerae]|uniref:ISL3 family transposase n=3 Tax=Azospirillum doebereinerae TaxID=92933 RepID=A0A433IZ29_9PROT|nr:ISL3 family transposase [Azospirillum doebereinerae]RUQ59304.1 ISL3 family transposase [Azospirillum doebereinerae]